jgi:flagellar biosynthesis repressor protein FlbT
MTDRNFRLYLKAGEKLYLNGAVVRVDRKVSIELLNDVTFLLEAYVMQQDQIKSQFDQLYFCVQTMLLQSGRVAGGVVERLLQEVCSSVECHNLRTIISDAGLLIDRGQFFDALKLLKPHTSIAGHVSKPETQKRYA